jgi:hypothetical protein
MRRCGYCEADLVGKRADAVYCDDLCRRAAWAERTGYRAGNGRERIARPRTSGRSGLQVSYRKAEAAAVRAAVLAFAAGLSRGAGGPPGSDVTGTAERLMRDALSPAQRTRLEELRT